MCDKYHLLWAFGTYTYSILEAILGETKYGSVHGFLVRFIIGPMLDQNDKKEKK